MIRDLPPQAPRKKGPINKGYVEFAEQLRAEPGGWAPFPVQFEANNKASNAQWRIRTGFFAAFRPAGHFDAVVRQGTLYVRYVGETQ